METASDSPAPESTGSDATDLPAVPEDTPPPEPASPPEPEPEPDRGLAKRVWRRFLGR
ncbi:hypothetical protein [Corynebacterium sp. TAE3-ERU16]|uniref:hypothetical protein n=1 Tax=Corynebacterium sp. TAE3-ERU16 TaxID=2849493 RepID=UPI001C477D91|nr:hypothetical protein [Corynebacterium sp. TAE3-ERU16]MBV7293510.1 hypothetical protein [Corynebacterium sp. TAE3-ERU16]